MRKNLKTKRRKPKRFEFKFVENFPLEIIEENEICRSSFFKDVDVKILGNYGYHWAFDGFYTAFHVWSRVCLCSFRKESEVKTFIKKLGQLEGIDMSKTKIEYDPDVDIPF